MKTNMRHFVGVLREHEGNQGCPHCGADMHHCRYTEIQAVTYEYDPKTGMHVPIEYVSPEELDYIVSYDDAHPEVLGKCNKCGHEWTAFSTDE
jgi:predicted RNA-binding Zn-ribbon protein involved in translation (DUF1610 family)